MASQLYDGTLEDICAFAATERASLAATGPARDQALTAAILMEQGFGSYKALTHLRVPDGLTSIGIRALADCSALVAITLPETIISIGESALPTPWV